MGTIPKFKAFLFMHFFVFLFSQSNGKKYVTFSRHENCFRSLTWRIKGLRAVMSMATLSRFAISWNKVMMLRSANPLPKTWVYMVRFPWVSLLLPALFKLKLPGNTLKVGDKLYL